MKSILAKGVYALTLLLAGAAQGADWDNWDTVHSLPEASVTVGGETREVSPRCALGDDYQFYFKAGKEEQLVVYFAGGGACWDSATCIGSLGIGSLDENGNGIVDEGEESDFVYIGSIDKADNPAVGMGGLFNLNPRENPKLDHKDNPYADWSMLFVPYCTGDVHVGSSDTAYEYPPDSGVYRKIYHRGFDNFLYAMNWLKTNHREVRPEKILVAGSSAGAYGATLNYPWVHEFYPDADKVFLASDAGVGVLTGADEFSDTVFGESSVWNVHDTIHPDLESALDDDADDEVRTPVIPAVYDLLRTKYRNGSFGQYTTAYDAVQILFWDIMLNPPDLWLEGLEDPLFIFRWKSEMQKLIRDQWSVLPNNYRAYIAPGCNHTILGFDDDFYESSLKPRIGREEISFLDWLSAMTEEDGADRGDWRNLSCSFDRDCGEANLNEGIGDCLARSYPLYF